MRGKALFKRGLHAVRIDGDLAALQVGVLCELAISHLGGFLLDVGEEELFALCPHLDLRIRPDGLAVAVGAGGQIGNQGQRRGAADVDIHIFRVAAAALHFVGHELLIAVDQHAEFHAAHIVVAVDAVDADPCLEALCVEAGEVIDDFGGRMCGDALVIRDLAAILIDADLVAAQVGVLGKGTVADRLGGLLQVGQVDILIEDKVHGIDALEAARTGGRHNRLARDCLRLLHRDGHVVAGCGGGDLWDTRGRALAGGIGEDVAVEAFNGLAVDLDVHHECGVVRQRGLAVRHELFGGRVVDGLHAEQVGVGLVGRQRVLLQRLRAAACAAQAHLMLVDRDDRILGPLYVIEIPRLLQIFLGIMQSADFHNLLRVEEQAVAGIVGDGQPAGIRLVAHLLRLEEAGELFAHRAVVYADVMAPLAIPIAVGLAAAIPLHVLIAGGHLQAHADAQQVVHGAVRHQGAAHHHIAVGIDGEGGGILRIRCRRHGHIHCDNDLFLLLEDVKARDFRVFDRVLPLCVVGGLDVVVGDRTPEVRLQRLRQQLFAVGRIGGELTARLVKGHAEGIVCNGERRIALLDLPFGERRHAALVDLRQIVLGHVECKLLGCDLMAGVRPPAVLLGGKANVQEAFLAGLHIRRCGVSFQRDVHRLLRRHVCGLGVLRNDFAVADQLPGHIVLVRIRIDVFVGDGDHTRFQILCRHLEGLVDLLYLIHRRMDGPVRAHQTIAAEIVLSGVDVPSAVIRPEGLAGLRAGDLGVDRLVRPVPDPAALEVRVLPDDVPIVLQAACAVAHGVVVFAHDEWERAALAVLLNALASGIGRVHLRLHVNIRAVVPALVVDQAGWVVLVKVLEHPLQGLAGANLVAGGPHQHAGIVLIALQHADRALLTGDHIAGDVAGYAGVQPAAVVGFVVRLVHDIDAVLVAQLIEIRVVRIVRGAHRIQIVLLEQLDVRLHLLVGEVAARLRRHLAAVYALKVDRLAVQNHLCIGGAAVDHIKLAETDVLSTGSPPRLREMVMRYRFGCSAFHLSGFSKWPVRFTTALFSAKAGASAVIGSPTGLPSAS